MAGTRADGGSTNGLPPAASTSWEAQLDVIDAASNGFHEAEQTRTYADTQIKALGDLAASSAARSKNNRQIVRENYLSARIDTAQALADDSVSAEEGLRLAASFDPPESYVQLSDNTVQKFEAGEPPDARQLRVGLVHDLSAAIHQGESTLLSGEHHSVGGIPQADGFRLDLAETPSFSPVRDHYFTVSIGDSRETFRLRDLARMKLDEYGSWWAAQTVEVVSGLEAITSHARARLAQLSTQLQHLHVDNIQLQERIELVDQEAREAWLQDYKDPEVSLKKGLIGAWRENVTRNDRDLFVRQHALASLIAAAQAAGVEDIRSLFSEKDLVVARQQLLRYIIDTDDMHGPEQYDHRRVAGTGYHSLFAPSERANAAQALADYSNHMREQRPSITWGHHQVYVTEVLTHTFGYEFKAVRNALGGRNRPPLVAKKRP